MSAKTSKRRASQRGATAGSAELQRSMLCDKLNFSASEAYKLLRTNLLFSLPDEQKCRVVGITSSVRGEGKTTTAINLSYTLAETGKRVLLVDADMRLPSISKKLSIPSQPGLSNCLVGMNNLQESILPSVLLKTFSILPAGTLPPNPSELLGSERMGTLLDEMKKNFDFIIVDLPPVNIVSDALVISKLMDGMVMAVRQNYSDQMQVNECMHHLKFLDTKLLGVVLTSAEEIG
ncbi:MAG: CpsD/CapB family tyrosine-protein kinase, partial [Clostridia bacterium]|nr:CpsD/CapB family tyrosine-protein kinase [Clostridia bacterium]